MNVSALQLPVLSLSKAFDCKGTEKNKMGLKNNSFVRNIS